MWMQFNFLFDRNRVTQGAMTALSSIMTFRLSHLQFLLGEDATNKGAQGLGSNDFARLLHSKEKRSKSHNGQVLNIDAGSGRNVPIHEGYGRAKHVTVTAEVLACLDKEQKCI